MIVIRSALCRVLYHIIFKISKNSSRDSLAEEQTTKNHKSNIRKNKFWRKSTGSQFAKLNPHQNFSP